MKKTKSILKTLLFYIIVILVWYGAWFFLVKQFGVVNGDLFVSPIAVFTSFYEFFFLNANSFWANIAMSLSRLFLGYLLSIGMGIVLAVVMLRSKIFRDELRAFLSGIQSLPNICWVPFAIILCGIDESSVYFVMAFGASASIALAIESSIRNVEPMYIKAGRTLCCNKIGMVTRIILPASFPGILSGLRQGWAFSWRALMAGEMNCLFSAEAYGIGYLMYNLRFNGCLDKVLCIMIILVIIGVFFEKTVFGTIENKILTKRGIRREND